MSFWKRIFGIKQPEKKETKNIPTKEQFIEESDDFLPREDEDKENNNNTEQNIIIMTDLKSFFEKYSHDNKEFCESIEQRGREDAEKSGMLSENKERGLRQFLHQVSIDFEKVEDFYTETISERTIDKLKYESHALDQNAKRQEERIKYYESKLKKTQTLKEAFNNEEGVIYDFVNSLYERGFDSYACRHYNVLENKT